MCSTIGGTGSQCTQAGSSLSASMHVSDVCVSCEGCAWVFRLVTAIVASEPVIPGSRLQLANILHKRTLNPNNPYISAVPTLKWILRSILLLSAFHHLCDFLIIKNPKQHRPSKRYTCHKTFRISSHKALYILRRPPQGISFLAYFDLWRTVSELRLGNAFLNNGQRNFEKSSARPMTSRRRHLVEAVLQ